MLRDRATRALTYNDEQFHALEKIKTSETGKRLKLLLQEDVKPVVAQIAECLADWYKRAQTVYLKTQILEKDAVTCDDALFSIRQQISSIKEEFKSDDAALNVNIPDNHLSISQIQCNQFSFLLQKNQLATPEVSFFTRDIQNNIRVSIAIKRNLCIYLQILIWKITFSPNRRWLFMKMKYST